MIAKEGMMVKVMRSTGLDKFDRKKTLWRRIAEKLMFWRKHDKQLIHQQAQENLVKNLTDLWQASKTMEKESILRPTYSSKYMEMDLVPTVYPSKKIKRRMRKEAKQLQNTAKRMTQLAIRGKISIEQILPLAFPELKDWKFTCLPKTQGLKSFNHVEVSDEAMSELTDNLSETKELTKLWTWRLERLCMAVAGAALFLEAGGTKEDALTIMSGNCEPVMDKAFYFANSIKHVPLSQKRFELEKFAKHITTDPRWRKKERSIQDLLENAGVCRD
jgi:hypothetical protein